MNNFDIQSIRYPLCYRYIIYNYKVRSAIFEQRATWYYEDLNVATMQQAANYLIGELDFSAFRSSQCESKSPMRNMQRIVINRYDDFVVIELEADAFCIIWCVILSVS